MVKEAKAMEVQVAGKQGRKRRRGDDLCLEYCEEHDLGFPRGGVCALCPVAQKLPLGMKCCTKHDEDVYFKKASCPMCRLAPSRRKVQHSASSGGSSGATAGGVTDTALAVGKSMAAAMGKLFKGGRKRKMLGGSSSDEDDEEESPHRRLASLLKDMDHQETVLEMATRAESPMDIWGCDAGSKAWAEEFNLKLEENEAIRLQVMKAGRKARGITDADELHRIAIGLAWSKQQWTNNEARMRMLKRAVNQTRMPQQSVAEILSRVTRKRMGLTKGEDQWDGATRWAASKEAKSRLLSQATGQGVGAGRRQRGRRERWEGESELTAGDTTG
jgi:hypothetical protein